MTGGRGVPAEATGKLERGGDQMKAYVFVDMEGITGVTPGGHNEVTEEEKHLLQVGDVNAAIEGALEGGATEVLVQMAHGRPRLRELHPKAQYVTGAVLPLCLSGIDESFGCVLHVGCHARAGAERGVLGHTVTGRVFELSLNGVVVGEAGIVAAMAGQFGVPTALVKCDPSCRYPLATFESFASPSPDRS